MKYCVVTPWHDSEQKNKFLEAWGVKEIPDWLILQQDKNKEGCAITKNKGIKKALQKDTEVVIILDDDCYPVIGPYDPKFYFTIPSGIKRSDSLDWLVTQHIACLEPKPVELYEAVTDPPSRGTPYFNRTITMPVAASMGFWTDHPDWDAPSQLIYQPNTWRPNGFTNMVYYRKNMFQRFFPFSGMNCSFRTEFWPFFKFDETAPRYDDIFMGYRLQAEAYERGYCINLNGPTVRHVRQSNVWNNLKIEAENMERNETEWQKYV